MTARPVALALVESPAQLLNLLEWALGERDGAPEPARCEAAVLLPLDPATRHQLRVMAEVARAEGIDVGLYDIRKVPVGFTRALTSLVRKLTTADRLVIGDPFSGIIQRLLPLTRTRDFVLLDDGTATLELSPEPLAGRPLVRWHHTGSAPGAAARAARRLTPGPGTRLEVFNCRAAASAPPGVIVSPHTYSWARQRYGPPQVSPGVDMIGTSLAETGLVDPGRYVHEVAALAHQLNVERYFAHRREDPDKLRLLAEYGELEIVRPELPLEVELLKGPVADTLVALPSTALHTLPRVLAGTGVEVTVCADVTDWLQPDVSERAAAFLTEAFLTEVIHA
ncbi:MULTISPECIES: hypothetical protein [unclassified Streptomyces]|uniref:hypothetical protein n=1 Tax=unclassified Streptomyces TaxID=2593676 RepID=UPI002E7FC4D4|nr:hypothetical protein [Streptomyces sp. NBC_00589]WTI37120.1 hypothetical protein OIC96_19925 [Streptomyces sp. NBC_00775]WUB29204.1 hypothetical protein OHA51_29810 [Streptomyces sp. NBC_00589]